MLWSRLVESWSQGCSPAPLCLYLPILLLSCCSYLHVNTLHHSFRERNRERKRQTINHSISVTAIEQQWSQDYGYIHRGPQHQHGSVETRQTPPAVPVSLCETVGSTWLQQMTCHALISPWSQCLIRQLMNIRALHDKMLLWFSVACVSDGSREIKGAHYCSHKHCLRTGAGKRVHWWSDWYLALMPV